VKDSLEWWQLISEKRCDGYSHSQEDGYNEARKAFLQYMGMPSCGPRSGKLVHQLPGVVTFAYDLCFRRVIARWKGIVEEIHFGGSIMPLDIIENLDIEKTSGKWPRK
jgi:hypothetical protein